MNAPLTPPECDLQDFPFMPLHVARLRDSDLAAEADPEACWYAVLLWSAAWHQIPAGSLPDNETVLARLCGLGRDLKTFRKHRADAMRGFVLCSDGRLYHPVVAEQACAAWESKLQLRWRTECARVKKANQRNNTDLPLPTYEQFLAGQSTGQSGPRPEHVPGDTDDCPSGQGVQETGTGTGIKEEEVSNETFVGSAEPMPTELAETIMAFARAAAKPPAKPRLVPTLAEVEAVWDITPRLGRERSSRKDLERALTAAMRRGHDPASVLDGVRAAYASTTYGGDHAKGVHRLIEADRWQTFVEAATPATQADAPKWPGPRQVRDAVVAAAGEDVARGFLDPATWRPAPDRAVICRNSFSAQRLSRDAGSALSRMGVAITVAEGVAA